MADKENGCDSGNHNLSPVVEKEVCAQLAELAEKLESNSSEWTHRVDALGQVRKVISSTLPRMPAPQFAKCCRCLRDSLVAQLQDLRSAIVREACTTVAFMAEQFGLLDNSFNWFAESMIEAALKGTIVTIKVISEATNQCIERIIASTRSGFPRAFARLLQGCASKSSLQRQLCTRYTTICLQSWKLTTFTKRISDLESTILATLVDADSGARANARECFTVFNDKFPDQGAALKKRLDPQTTKLLGSMSTTHVKPKAISRQSSTVGPESTRQTRPPAIQRQQSAPVLHSSRPARLAVEPPSASQVKSGARDSAPKSGALETDAHPPNRGRPPTFSSLGGPSRRSSSISNRPGPGRTLQHADRRASVQETSERRMAGPQRIVRVPSSSQSTRQQTQSQHALSQRTGASRVTNTRMSRPGRTGGATRREPSLDRGSGAAIRSQDGFTSGAIRSHDGFASGASQAAPNLKRTVEKLASTLKDTLWSNRVSGLNLFKMQVERFEAVDIARGASKIGAVFATAIDDVHYKVVVAALEVCHTWVLTHHECFVAVLDKFIYQIITKCTDQKAQVKMQASTLFDLLRECFAGDELTSVVTKTCFLLNHRVNLGTVQAMTKLAPQSATFYLSNSGHMYSVVLQTVTVAQQHAKSLDLQNACAEFLCTLLDQYATVFVGQFERLSPAAQRKIKAMVGKRDAQYLDVLEHPEEAIQMEHQEEVVEPANFANADHRAHASLGTFSHASKPQTRPNHHREVIHLAHQHEQLEFEGAPEVLQNARTEHASDYSRQGTRNREIVNQSLHHETELENQRLNFSSKSQGSLGSELKDESDSCEFETFATTKPLSPMNPRLCAQPLTNETVQSKSCQVLQSASRQPLQPKNMQAVPSKDVKVVPSHDVPSVPSKTNTTQAPRGTLVSLDDSHPPISPKKNEPPVLDKLAPNITIGTPTIMQKTVAGATLPKPLTPIQDSHTDVEKLQGILRDLKISGATERFEALKQIEKMLPSPTLASREWAAQIINSVVERLGDVQVKLVKFTGRLLCKMMKTHKSFIQDSFETTFLAVFACYRKHGDIETVKSVCEDALTLLVRDFDETRALPILTNLIVQHEDGASVTLALSLVSILNKNCSVNNFMEHFPKLFPGVVVLLSNKDVSIRRASVCCLADVFNTVGDAFLPFLNTIPDDSSRTLVNDYREKLRK